MQDECFTELRTNEGLGYVVSCFSTSNEGIGSFQALVQSEEFLPEEVLDSMDSFLNTFYEETVTSDDFSTNFSKTVEVLRQTLLRRDLRLEDKTDKLWAQILSGQQQFNFRDQLVAKLPQLTPEGFQQFYNETIVEQDSRHRLVVVVYGLDKDFDLLMDVDNLVDYDHLDQTSTTLRTDT